MIADHLFKKIEKKTNVNKETILSLASKLQNSDIKNEKNIRELIDELSNITGKEVSEEKKEKIIKTVLNDNIPDISKMI